MNAKMRTVLNDSPIGRTILIVVLVPLLSAVIVYAGFKKLVENHMEDESEHVIEEQSHLIATIPAITQDIASIETDLKEQVTKIGKISNRITAVEEGFRAIQITQTKQDTKLDQIVTILLENKP